MNRRVFVFGSHGMLGWMLVHFLKKAGHSVIPLSRDEFDVMESDVETLHKTYSFQKEDVFINAIGVINRHMGSVSDEVFMKINAEFPQKLDNLAGDIGCTFVHITTDCVFKGDQGGYWETVRPEPEDIYGISKLEGEKLENAIILRTSLIGIEAHHHRNLISWVLDQENSHAQGYTNHTWNGITTLECAKIINSFLDQGFPSTGLYHLFSKRIVTKHELIKLIAHVFNVPIDLEPFHTQKPTLRHLTSVKALCESLTIPDIEEQLHELKEYCIRHHIQWKST